MTGQFQVELSVAGDSVLLGKLTGSLVIDGSLEEVIRSASAARAAEISGNAPLARRQSGRPGDRGVWKGPVLAPGDQPRIQR